jgi:hypothetical protein
MANIVNPIVTNVEVVEIVTAGPQGKQGPPGSLESFEGLIVTGSSIFSGSTFNRPTLEISGSINVSGSFNFTGDINISGSFTGSYLYSQGSPLSTWVIPHNLRNLYPNVIVYDLDKNQMLPQNVTAISTSSLSISFPTPTSGYAYVSIGTNLAIPNFNSLSTSSISNLAQSIIFGF